MVYYMYSSIGYWALHQHWRSQDLNPSKFKYLFSAFFFQLLKLRHLFIIFFILLWVPISEIHINKNYSLLLLTSYPLLNCFRRKTPMPAYCFTGIHCIDRYSIILFNIILIRMCGACKIYYTFHRLSIDFLNGNY